jgi:hypothetical protein
MKSITGDRGFRHPALNGLPIYHLSVSPTTSIWASRTSFRRRSHSNTLKHILLFQALDRTPTAHGAVDSRHRRAEVEQWHGMPRDSERIGYLPDAMVAPRAAWVVARRRSRGDVARRVDRRSLDGTGGAAVFDPGSSIGSTRILARLNPDDLRAGEVAAVRRLWTDELDAEGRREYAARVALGVAGCGGYLNSSVRPRRSSRLRSSTIRKPSKHLTSADLDWHVEALIAALEENVEPYDEAAIERMRSVATHAV